MIHISHHGHVPSDLVWGACTHKPTAQRYIVMPNDFAVETIHGTMTGRAGDVLMEGANGSLYVITAKAFDQVFG